MDHTPNQYDTDYSRHVKAVDRDQALQSERDDAFQRKIEWYAKTPTQRHHEPFAHLLGVVAFLGAGYSIHKNHSGMEWWLNGLISLGAGLVVAWFFRTFRFLTNLVMLILAGAVIFYGSAFFMNN